MLRERRAKKSRSKTAKSSPTRPVAARKSSSSARECGPFSPATAAAALRVCMEGKGHSKAELRRIGQELVDRVTQQYVYHRVMTEMKQRNMHVVSEEVAEDRTVKIRVRNW